MSLFQTAFFLISVSGLCSNEPPVELTAVRAARLRSDFWCFLCPHHKEESQKYFQCSTSVNVLAQALCVPNFRHGNDCTDPGGTYTVCPQGLVLLARPKNILLIWRRSRGTLQTCWICLYQVQENRPKAAPA